MTDDTNKPLEGPALTMSRIRETSPYQEDLYDDHGVNPWPQQQPNAARQAEARTDGKQDAGGEGEPTGPDADVSELAGELGLSSELASMLSVDSAPMLMTLSEITRDMDISLDAMAQASDWFLSAVKGGLTGEALEQEFRNRAADMGLDARQVEELIEWGQGDGSTSPAPTSSRGRESWHTSGQNIPARIKPSDIPRMSTDQLRLLMKSNFNLYKQSGADVELSKRLARGR